MKKQSNKIDLNTLPKPIKQYIKQLERVRSDFVASVSHELRTPLTVIQGYLETLTTSDTSTIQDWKPIFDQMYRHSIRMENIIKDLLFLSRLEVEDHLTETREDVAVPEILATICADAERIGKAKQHIIRLEADRNLTMCGFAEELKSLFSNIIINAVKYTPIQGKITIHWQRDGDKAIFSVSDTGIGVAEAHIPRLTERFYRVEKDRSRESGGTGLGLAIVKHVLMRHDGELTINSTLGKGSIFRCTFPLKIAK